VATNRRIVRRGVLPGSEVTIDKITGVSGNAEGPATVAVDVTARAERHRILVHVGMQWWRQIGGTPR
jgi:hypothetical protein